MVCPRLARESRGKVSLKMSGKTIGFAPLNDEELAALRVSVWSNRKRRNPANELRARREQNLAIHRLLLDAFYDAFLVNPSDKVYTAPRMSEFLKTMTDLNDEKAFEIVRWIKRFSVVQYNKNQRVFEINKQVTGKLSLYSISDESQRVNIFWQWAIASGVCCVENHNELYNIIRKRRSLNYPKKTSDLEKGLQRANKTEVCDTCKRRITFLLDDRGRQKAFDIDKNKYILGPHICNELPNQSVYAISGGAIDSNRERH